jgi:hypothetical protein
MEFNIIVTVGTSEVDLAPYPNGSSTTPSGMIRKIYVAVLTNSYSGSNTLTLKIYKGSTLEKSLNIVIPSPGTLALIKEKKEPIILIPSGRTFKAVSSTGSMDVLMTGFDE